MILLCRCRYFSAFCISSPVVLTALAVRLAAFLFSWRPRAVDFFAAVFAGAVVLLALVAEESVVSAANAADAPRAKQQISVIICLICTFRKNRRSTYRIPHAPLVIHSVPRHAGSTYM